MADCKAGAVETQAGATRPFFFPCPPYLLPMPTLFDPLAYLATLGAYAKVSIDADGERYITLEYKRGISSKAQLQAKAIAKRYERLLLIQLDVPIGTIPRTIQQLVASGRVRVEGRKFKKVE